MYKNNKILGIIPARAGSKGVSRKNLRLLADKPLLTWTIEAAKSSAYLDRILLSSEDDEIIKVAKDYGLDVPFKRPVELAQDDTPSIDPVLHALNELRDENYTHVVLLQPTSPFRTGADIDAAIKLCLDENAPSCISVTETVLPPWWMFRLDTQKKLLPIIDTEQIPLRRQDAPKAYQLNGAIYVSNCDYLKKQNSFICPETIAYVMPSNRSMDIDSELDFALAELIIKTK